MNPFEYIVTLVSVLVGLAIADISVSFNRLLRARAKVRWDWLPMLASFMAVLALFDIWWMFYGEQEATFYRSLAGFLPFAAQLVLLFLINAAALPDDVPQEGLDLKKFYHTNSPYFWTLFVVYFISIFLTRSISMSIANWDFIFVLKKSYSILILAAAFGSLIFVKNRIFHALVILTFLVLYFSRWAIKGLGAVQ